MLMNSLGNLNLLIKLATFSDDNFTTKINSKRADGRIWRDVDDVTRFGHKLFISIHSKVYNYNYMR